MICRGTIISAPLLLPGRRQAHRTGIGRLSIFATIAAIAVLATATRLTPGISLAPPLIESDYCYLLTAVDRAEQGYGFTTPHPVAPFQPWEWREDWEFLTRWPIGYPILLYLTKASLSYTALQAAKLISAFAFSAALVGWFVFIRRAIGSGIASILLAALGAISAVDLSLLVSPSTDLIVTAALPFLLLMATKIAARPTQDNQPASTSFSRLPQSAGLGLLCGSLFWIRYAGIFVPLAMVGFFVATTNLPLRNKLRLLSAFATAAAVPIALLICLNRWGGMGESTQAQLNLGNRILFSLSPGDLWLAWWTFTDFGFYPHHPLFHWFMALLPLLGIASLALPPARAAMKQFWGQPEVRVSLCGIASLLGMLLLTTALFRDKFNYLALDRYYSPIRPLYFLVFVGPLLLAGWRVARGLSLLFLLLLASWDMHDWSRDWMRITRTDAVVTPYGQRSRIFGDHAEKLYAYLAANFDDRDFVVSNFGEWVTLETGLPVAPVPQSKEQLDRWLNRAAVARNIPSLRPVFILDADPKWRNYWIPPTVELIDRFDLKPLPGAPETIRPYVFVPGDWLRIKNRFHAGI